MGVLIPNLPAWCIEAKTTANGFQGGFIRRDQKPMIVSGSFNKIRKGVIVDSSFPVVADFALSAFVSTADKARALAGAVCDLSINVYVLPTAAVPDDLSTLNNIWTDRHVLPYDSNMYSATLKQKFSIPLSKGLFLIEVTLDDMADIQSFPSGRSMTIQESVSITGVPADKQQEFYQSVIEQIGSIVQRLDTEIAKFTALIEDTDNITTLASKMDAQTAQLATQITKMDAMTTALQAIQLNDYTDDIGTIKTALDTLKTNMAGI